MQIDINECFELDRKHISFTFSSTATAREKRHSDMLASECLLNILGTSEVNSKQPETRHPQVQNYFMSVFSCRSRHRTPPSSCRRRIRAQGGHLFPDHTWLLERGERSLQNVRRLVQQQGRGTDELGQRRASAEASTRRAVRRRYVGQWVTTSWVTSLLDRFQRSSEVIK